MDMKTLNYFETLSCGNSGALDVSECETLDDVKRHIDIFNEKCIKDGYRHNPIKYGIYCVTRLRVFDNDSIIANETTSKTLIEIYPQN